MINCERKSEVAAGQTQTCLSDTTWMHPCTLYIWVEACAGVIRPLYNVHAWWQ